MKSGKSLPDSVKEKWNLSHLMMFKSTRNCEECTVCEKAKDKTRKISQKTKIRREKEKRNKTMHLCKKCFGPIGKGIRHSCSPGKEKCNIVEYLQERPDKVQEQIVSSTMKNIYASKNEAYGNSINLSTGILFKVYTLYFCFHLSHY